MPKLDPARVTAVSRVSSNGLDLAKIEIKFRDDDEIVRLAVSNNGNALAFASERLQKNYDIVSTAVIESPDAIIHAQLNLNSERQLNLLLDTIKRADCDLIDKLDPQYLKNRCVLLTAIYQYPLLCLRFSEDDSAFSKSTKFRQFV